jgi:hypothetical protein
LPKTHKYASVRVTRKYANTGWQGKSAHNNIASKKERSIEMLQCTGFESARRGKINKVRTRESRHARTTTTASLTSHMINAYIPRPERKT